jgi:hypothetical protein
MTNDQPAVVEEEKEWRCHFCQTIDQMISPEICRTCVQQILHKHYPRLRRHLELSYGEMIDNWLFTSARKARMLRVTFGGRIRDDIL